MSRASHHSCGKRPVPLFSLSRNEKQKQKQKQKKGEEEEEEEDNLHSKMSAHKFFCDLIFIWTDKLFVNEFVKKA